MTGSSVGTFSVDDEDVLSIVRGGDERDELDGTVLLVADNIFLDIFSTSDVASRYAVWKRVSVSCCGL